MKFTDGNWLVKEGYDIHFPRIVYDTKVEEQAVILYAPCKYINHRGDTLDGPMLTIKLSSPMENVIHVETWHYQGGKLKYPNFNIHEELKQMNIDDEEKNITFTSGDLNLSIDKEDFRMIFADAVGKIAEADQKSLAWITGPDDNTYMRGQLTLG